jgi:toxin ParE1/3/4
VSRPVFFLPGAEAELLEAQNWYDSQAFGLGDRFFAAIDVLLPRIGETPQQFPKVYGSIQRALVRHFPYALYFRVEAEGIFVVACAHTWRDPRRWRR